MIEVALQGENTIFTKNIFQFAVLSLLEIPKQNVKISRVKRNSKIKKKTGLYFKMKTLVAILK